jgi:molybdate transport system substrate-binding protein
VDVEFNFAGSPTLVTQLQEGAGADLLATADEENMARAAGAGLVGETATFARNKLAVIVPGDNPARLTTAYGLARDGLRLVLAAPDVPVGRYARQAIERMATAPEGGVGFADAVLANVVSEAPNVKAVVTAVQLGEADAGIVYVTDVTPDVAGDIEMIEIPDDVNVIGAYPIAVTTEAGDSELARAFVEFVLSDAGRTALHRYGFLAP